MKRRQFLTLLAAGASLAVPTRGFSNVLYDSVPASSEKSGESIGIIQQPTSQARDTLPMLPKIVDLHSHMFNLRYLPVESILNNWLKSRTFAWIAAQILYRMVGSSYRTTSSRHVMLQEFRQQAAESGQDTDSEQLDDFYIDEMWKMAKHELLLTTQEQNLIAQLKKDGEGPTLWMNQPKEVYPGLMNSDLFNLILKLEAVQYKPEWEAVIPRSKFTLPSNTLRAAKSISDLLDAAGYVLKRVLWVIVKLVLPKFVSEKGHSFGEFLFTLLASEELILDRFLKAYGDGLPPIRTVHYMMDMQMAYPGKTPAFYDFSTVQLDRMQTLWRRHPETLIGFSAFDPRRPDWEKLVITSRKKGFIGFKFYPALGYRPTDNQNKNFQLRINAFFDWCVKNENDVPIFTHCTPEGFEASKGAGSNAHPKYWRKALQKRKTLRLCLGHAGGGRMRKSAGWLATSDEEWATDDNYACGVVELCITYPNVYCEMAYITTLLAEDRDGKIRDTFLSNLERARKIKGEYDFMTKIAYGSDWHMPEMVTNARRYLDVWFEIFSLPDYKDYREQFFWKNSETYLKI